VLDINEAESDLMLATLDPLAAMARADTDTLLTLLESIEVENPAITAMLESLAAGETEPLALPGETPSLDDLADTYGDLDDEALWPVISLRVPPPLKVKFDDWLAAGDGDTEVERLADLLGR
jgi:hypothetical protein